MTALRRFLDLARPFKGALGWTALFYLLYTLVSLFSLGMIIPVLEVILNGDQASSASSTLSSLPADSFQTWLSNAVGRGVNHYGALGMLWRVCVGAMGLFGLKNLFRFGALWNMGTLRTGISTLLRQQLHDKILTLSPSTVSEKRKGDLLARASTDVTEVEWAILTGLELLVREPIVILGSLTLLVLMSWKLTLVLLFVAPVAGVLLQGVSKRLKRKSTEAQTRLGEVLSTLEETLTGLRVLQAFQAESQQSQRFAAINDQAFRSTRSVHRRRDLASPLSELIGVAALLIILFYGGREVLQGHGLSGATLVAYLLFFYQLIPAFKSVSMALYNVQKGRAAADRLFEVLSLPSGLPLSPAPHPWTCPDQGPATLAFESVTYTYPGATQPALYDFSLTLQRGQTIALVGPSGGGKTTLIHLLLRAMDPTQGCITVDGTPLPDLPLSDWRKALALVTQDAILFNANALDNITLGDPHPDKARAQAAAQKAQALAFIEAQPEGWASLLGEGGGKLSGGQRQRMALARALYRDAPVLLLDEATSALDAENERLVQEALEEACKGRTTVVVAHRLATVQRADCIVVVDQGRVVQKGSHAELMAQGGLYATLVKTQILAS